MPWRWNSATFRLAQSKSSNKCIAISNTKLLLIPEMKIPKDSLTPTMITEGAQRSKAQNIHTIYYYKGLIKPQAAHPYGKIDW
jgi:hypothetical protein